MVREIVMLGEGVALAELAEGDHEWLAEHGDGAFQIERDSRPMPFQAQGHHLALTNEDGVQINSANLTLNPNKKMVYVFEFTDHRNRALRSVRVEDVSDTVAIPLVDDAEPKLAAAGRCLHGELVDVGACHECLVAASGQNDDPDGVVAL